MPTIDELYWDSRYKQNKTGWDIGYPSEPIKCYIDQLTNKNVKILIPGCGNAYEAEYLIQQGFKNIHLVDISDTLVDKLKSNFKNEIESGQIKISKSDFFEIEETYDLIFEQTFFCALETKLRDKYAHHMNKLLNKNGTLSGLLFNYVFEEDGPPFGGNINEYKKIFAPYFHIKTIENCYNSIKPRAGKELFFILNKP
ncbi:MAG: methyltransferase domain-containing protein [Bacteroidia bacterium]